MGLLGMGGMPMDGMGGMGGMGGLAALGMRIGMGGMPMGMGGMGMPGMGGMPLGMNGMNMFTPQGQAYGVRMSFLREAMQLDNIAGKLSPKEFGQRLMKLLFQYKVAMWQSRHPLMMLLKAGAGALFGSGKVKQPALAAKQAGALGPAAGPGNSPGP
jgi:hypothetical protein